MTGKVVSSVYEGTMNAGSQLIEVNTSDEGLQNGLYFVEMISGSQRHVEKISILR